MRIAAPKFLKVSLAALTLCLLLLAASCAETNEANSNNANQNVNVNAKTPAAKDNAEELSTQINLPVLPDEKNDERVEWREENVEQKGKKLTAILKYNEENTARIIALAEKHKPAVPVEIHIEEWYPAELTAQTQLSGNESLKGIVYEAKDFYNPPYANGRLIKINESNYFILELTTY